MPCWILRLMRKISRISRMWNVEKTKGSEKKKGLVAMKKKKANNPSHQAELK